MWREAYILALMEDAGGIQGQSMRHNRFKVDDGLFMEGGQSGLRQEKDYHAQTSALVTHKNK